jgi:hypothetical protein
MFLSCLDIVLLFCSRRGISIKLQLYSPRRKFSPKAKVMTVFAIPAPTRTSLPPFTTKAKLAMAAEFLSFATDILFVGQDIIDPRQLRSLKKTRDESVLRPFLV